MNKKNLGNIPVFEVIKSKECCGCEACVNICPKKIINLEQNEEGFFYPTMDKNKCIQCDRCKKICPIIAEKNKLGDASLVSYAGSSLNQEVVKRSASGGMFFEIIAEWSKNIQGEFLISGVVYDNDYKGVHHILTEDLEEINLMRTSKYVQSRKANIYQKIDQALINEKNVLFSGTPCEIAALYSFLGKRPDKLLTVDIICQGPTAPKVLKEYTEMLEKKYHSKISYMNMRHKEGVWIPQYLLVEFESGKKLKNLFYDTSLGAALHIMQRQSCYDCKFIKENKYSDITIGDYHGADKSESYYNSSGTSILIGNTIKGIQLVEKLYLGDAVHLVKKEFYDIAQTNIRLIDTWGQLPERDRFVKYFMKDGIEVADRKTRKKSIKNFIMRNISIDLKKNILIRKQKKDKTVSM